MSSTMISLKPKTVIRHLPWRVDSKAALGFLLLLATFSLVGWLYLTQASAVTTTSYQIDELRMELDRLQNQNAALALEIAETKALSQIEARAQRLGLGPTTDVRYLTVSDYPFPIEQEKIFNIYEHTTVKIDYEVEIDTPPPWWVNTLDSLTAWLTEDESIVIDE